MQDLKMIECYWAANNDPKEVILKQVHQKCILNLLNTITLGKLGDYASCVKAA